MSMDHSDGATIAVMPDGKRIVVVDEGFTPPAEGAEAGDGIAPEHTHEHWITSGQFHDMWVDHIQASPEERERRKHAKSMKELAALAAWKTMQMMPNGSTGLKPMAERKAQMSMAAALTIAYNDAYQAMEMALSGDTPAKALTSGLSGAMAAAMFHVDVGQLAEMILQKQHSQLPPQHPPHH